VNDRIPVLRGLRRIAALLVVMLALPVGAAAGTVSGTLPQPGVVWVSDDSHPAPGPVVEMGNVNKMFVPDLVVIDAGGSVRFPNADPYFHSIYGQSGPDPFDLGFYDTGPGKTVVFAVPGVNTIRCHIHGSMHATIIVVDGPYAQTHAPNETYTLTNVRRGKYVLHVWTPGGGEQLSTIRVKR
jgi:plastocyanin